MSPPRFGPFLLLAVALAGTSCRRQTQSREQVGPQQLPLIQGLPDPFVGRKGRAVRTPADWPRRRQEIVALLERYQYGHAPARPGPRPGALHELSRQSIGPATRRLLRLGLGAQGIQLHLGLQVPRGEGPFPVIVHIDHRGVFHEPLAEETARRGYAVASYDPTFLDPDGPGIVGSAQAAYPNQDWATLAVWAWGAMRVVDHLLTMKWVDPARIVVTGHSRSGKAALWAGALDQRFALVVPQGSGCAGAASYRFRRGNVETLERITRSFPHWFSRELPRFAGHEQRLPFDQHMVLALVAPRALLSIDALGDVWANPYGTQISHMGAREVYAFLGAADRIGIWFRPGEHRLSDDDWRTMLDYADRVLRGAKTDRRSSHFARSARTPGEAPRLARFDRLPFKVEQRAFSWRAPWIGRSRRPGPAQDPGSTRSPASSAARPRR